MNLGSEHWELPHSWKGDLKGEILEIETLKRRGSIVPMIGGMVEKLGWFFFELEDWPAYNGKTLGVQSLVNMD